MDQSNPAGSRTRTSIAVGAGWGVAIEPVAILGAIMSAGAGHGSYAAARALFPFSLLLAQIEGPIGPASICVGLLQFPLYGALIGGMATSKIRTAAVLAAAHLAAVLACFSGLVPDFSG